MVQRNWNLYVNEIINKYIFYLFKQEKMRICAIASSHVCRFGSLQRRSRIEFDYKLNKVFFLISIILNTINENENVYVCLQLAICNLKNNKNINKTYFNGKTNIYNFKNNEIFFLSRRWATRKIYNTIYNGISEHTDFSQTICIQ